MRNVEIIWSKVMISFNLRCKNDHEFEGWFKNSDAFEAQNSSRQIACPSCGSKKVERALSAPNVSTARGQDLPTPEQAKKLRTALRNLRKQVESTHEDVGRNFPEEARKIHYGERERREIYGEATADEARDLVEEGVPVAPLPWIEEKADN